MQDGRGRYMVVGLIALCAVGLIAIVVYVATGAGLAGDSTALARVDLPLGAGAIKSVSVVSSRDLRPVPVELRGTQLWPKGLVRAGEVLDVQVVIKRPGWISWLAGDTERLDMTVRAPTASLDSHYLTLSGGAPLRLRFAQPVATISYGQEGALQRQVLASPEDAVTLPRTGEAGSIWVAAAPRSWETSAPAVVSWFPAGVGTAAVAAPAPGSRIQPGTPITLTFSKPVAQALGSTRPPVSPATQGTWHQVSAHSIVFRPEGYGYGLGTTVSVGLPSGIQLVGGQQSGASDAATWSVPPGSTVRLQQLLATLGYLPLRFNGPAVPLTPQAQEAAAVGPPAGQFSWRYGNVPSALRGMWQVGASGTMMQGAVMEFENDQGITPDGVPGAAVWRSLIAATISGDRSTFGYTFVTVSEGSPETETTWHNGRTVVSGPVNTGIPATPTALGTFTVFEHALSVTMSGTNADGSHYSDPGVPWVSYFNGGDALHGFIRASYGYPQSDGCVEMPYSEASAVYPYTPIGTLVNVT